MPSALRQEILNVPNALTVARIAAIPWIVLLVWDDNPVSNFHACLVFLAAAATDGIDGYLARRANLDSALGKLLDPLADKLLTATVMIALVPLGRLEAWIPMVILGREFTISGLRSLAAAEGIIIAARPLGKEKTVYQFIGLAFLLMGGEATFGWWQGAPHYSLERVGTILMLISVVYAIISAVDYLVRFTLQAMKRH
jgi:CDP-diacylglycerol---glycerol-3-phosphate 3-phosphatidyltransferase